MATRGKLTEPAVGKIKKVWLPRETPWAECMAVAADGTWMGRIDNDLVCSDEHGYAFDDVVRFVKKEEGEFDLWVPA